MDTVAIPELTGHESSAADRVYAFVKEGITSRRFPSQELLSEGQIAEAVGVSRTPVREGLLRLEVEGLIKLLPKRGALVVPVTPSEMADVMETRRLVETFAVRKVISTGANPQLLVLLGAHLSEMRAAMTRHDAAAYVDSDRAFHAEIVHAAGNQILESLYSSLRDRQLRMGVVNLLDPTSSAGDISRMRATLAEHKAILDAITKGSLRAAEAAVTTHLDAAERLLARSR